jgi:hypothetical protein
MGRPPSIASRMARAGAAALILGALGVEAFSLLGGGAGRASSGQAVRPAAGVKVLEAPSMLPGFSFFGGPAGEDRRAKTKGSPYGLLDFVIGPENRDLSTVDVPLELKVGYSRDIQAASEARQSCLCVRWRGIGARRNTHV